MTKKAKIIIIVLGAIVVLAVVVIGLSMFSPTKLAVKQTVSDSIGRTNFNVEKILIKEDDWILARIVSTEQLDKGNPALVILRHEDGELVLKFGPGTSFSGFDLSEAGVPNTILSVLFGNSISADPIKNMLPYSDRYYTISVNTTSSSDIVGINIRINMLEPMSQNNIESAEIYKAEALEKIREWGFNSEDYDIIFTWL